LGTTTIHQPGPPDGQESVVPLDITEILNWQASWMYEFGVTRYFDNGWHASAGFVFDENSVPNAYYTPLAADMDRYFLSAGAGYKGKRFDFDIAYQFGYGPAHTVTGSTPSSISGTINNQNANGTYGFISHAVLVSVGMHF
jgi:long-subunit fatty acid transport protein